MRRIRNSHLMDAFRVSRESRGLVGEQVAERLLADRAKNLDCRVVGVEPPRRGLAGLRRRAFFKAKAARRLAFDLDIERDGGIQVEGQPVKRCWRSLTQLKFELANVLSRASRINRSQVEGRFNQVPIDLN